MTITELRDRITKCDGLYAHDQRLNEVAIACIDKHLAAYKRLEHKARRMRYQLTDERVRYGSQTEEAPKEA